jgi:hypothetical protein
MRSVPTMSFTGMKGIPMAPAISMSGRERLVYSSSSILCGIPFSIERR